MSSKSKKGLKRGWADQPQPGEEELAELRTQADEAVKLLTLVRPQLPRMVDVIPRGQMVEYLRHGSRRTYARYFKGFRPEHIPRSRLLAFLSEEIYENQNGILAHLLIVLWNDQNKALYEAAKKRLQVLNPNVELIEYVPPELSAQIIEELCSQFPREDVAVLCLVNDARFDREVLHRLLPEWDWPPLKAGLTAAEREKLAEMQQAQQGEAAPAVPEQGPATAAPASQASPPASPASP